MAFIVIAGIPDCPKYAHAEYVANYMSTHLPNFNVHRIVKSRGVWEKWLLKICMKHGWHHYKCPIVWKELAMPGGRGILIGGLSNFLEYCYEYYGLESILTTEEKKLLIMDNLEQFKIAQKKKYLTRTQHKVRHVCISGANSPTTPVLLGELLRMPCLAKREGTVVLLYDSQVNKKFLKKMVQCAASLCSTTGLGAARIALTLQEGLKNCDVLIVLDGYPREKDESQEDWLTHNHRAMLDLAAEVTEHAPRRCRVILAPCGTVPLCFNATVFVEAAIGLIARNVVAVTADLGFEALTTVTRLTKTSLVDLANPPVWGFVGINHLIDLDSMLYRASYYVPNKRALKRIPGSTLPLGEIVVELRPFCYMLHNVVSDIWQQILNRKKTAIHLLGRPSCLAKIKGLIGLLRLWYSNTYDGEIISLGVLSNDTFGIPAGIIFSQPVILVDGFWMPYGEYHEPKDVNCGLKPLYETAMYILQKFGIGKQYKIDWLLSENERKRRRMTSHKDSRMQSRQEDYYYEYKMAEAESELKALRDKNRYEIVKIMNRDARFIQEMLESEMQHVIEDILPQPMFDSGKKIGGRVTIVEDNEDSVSTHETGTPRDVGEKMFLYSIESQQSQEVTSKDVQSIIDESLFSK